MAKVKAATSPKASRTLRPALSPEARENQLIALAYDRAEEQLQNGTASSQTINYFLNLGSAKEKLKLEQLEEENRLLKAKTEALEAEKDMKKVYVEALNAMKLYSGNGDPDEY